MDTIKDLILTFTSNIKIFCITWVLTFVLLALLSFTLTEIYRAEMILVPTEDSQSELKSLGSAGGALASLAGITLETQVSRSQKALAKIRSRSFFKELLAQYGETILPGLVAAKGYDKKNRTLYYDSDIFLDGIWYRNKDFDVSDSLFLEEAYEKFLKNLRVNENRLSGLITISFDHISPVYSYEVLSRILLLINDSERVADQFQAQYAIDFINNSLGGYSNDQLRRSASVLLERQLQIMMLSNSKKYYLLEPIDGPNIPAKRFFPSRAFIVIVGEIIISLLLFCWLYFSNDIRQFIAFIKQESA